MDYKDVCVLELNRYRNIINVLADARDRFKSKSAEERFFQAQIEAVASLKNQFEADYMNAQIAEAKKV